MNFKILGKEWEILEVDVGEDFAMATKFPARLIEINSQQVYSESELKHFLLHELTHAFTAECGMWQNTLGNGKHYDSFDAEWISEFVAIHSEDIIKICYEIIDKL